MKVLINELPFPENAFRVVFHDRLHQLPPDAEETLTYLLEALEPREADIFVLRYKDGLSYREIGEKHGVSKERIRQTLSKTERKLRHPHRSKILRLGLEAYHNSLAAGMEKAKKQREILISALRDIVKNPDIRITEYKGILLGMDIV